MRKIYALALLAASTLAASANGTTDILNQVAPQRAVFPEKTATLTRHDMTKGAPAKAASASEIAGVYDAKYYGPLSSNSGWNTAQFTISATSDTELSIVGFYSIYPVTGTYDSEAGTITMATNQVMLHNTYYDEDVYFTTGRWNDNGQGFYATESLVGTVEEDGSISFDSDDLFFVQVTAGYFNAGYYLSLTPYVEPTYSFSVTNCLCAADNLFSATIEAENVADIKVGLFLGKYSASDANFSYVATNGSSIEPGDFSFSFDGKDAGAATIFFVALDESGNVLEGVGCRFYITYDNDDEWELLGKATYTDNIVTSSYNFGVTSIDYEVEVQQSTGIENYYRIVNPYGASTPFSNYSLTDHNHYLYINAYDPEAVVIEESPIGIDVEDDDSEMWVVGLAPTYGTTYGTMVDNVITFPASSILVGYGNGSSLYYSNKNGLFSLILPEGDSGVKDLTTHNSHLTTPVYYNLQGQIVTNPVAGQLYIEKTGSDARKIIY